MQSVQVSNLFLDDVEMLLYVYNRGLKSILYIHGLTLCYEFKYVYEITNTVSLS